MVATRTSAEFAPLLPFASWMSFGGRLGAHASASSWWLGDWLLFGQMKYGRRYKDAIGITGLDYQTLRNYACVSRRFGPSRRRGDLTFQHHAEVCALSNAEQDSWLDQAVANHWSRNELRRRLRAARALEPRRSQVVRIEVDANRAHRWREAATRSNCDFDTWLVQALDSAARR